MLDEATAAKIHHQANNLAFDPAALGFVFTDEEITREWQRMHNLHNPLRPSHRPWASKIGSPRKVA